MDRGRRVQPKKRRRSGRVYKRKSLTLPPKLSPEIQMYLRQFETVQNGMTAEQRHYFQLGALWASSVPLPTRVETLRAKGGRPLNKLSPENQKMWDFWLTLENSTSGKNAKLDQLYKRFKLTRKEARLAARNFINRQLKKHSQNTPILVDQKTSF